MLLWSRTGIRAERAVTGDRWGEELAAFNFSARNDEALQGLISLSTLSHRLRPVLPFTPNHTPSTPISLRLWVLHGGFNLKVLVPSSVSRFVNGTQVWDGLTARAMMEKSCFQRLSMWRELILELKQTDHPQSFNELMKHWTLKNG